MKTIKVVAALICDSLSEKKKVFATARGYGEFKGWWEFPGGKIEKGESPQQALKREIKEELNTEINVGESVGTVEYDYPSFHLSMECFWCTVIQVQWYEVKRVSEEKISNFWQNMGKWPHLSKPCFLSFFSQGSSVHQNA